MGRGAHELGRRGESAAADWLTSRGWRILDQRWRGSGGELDLVGLDPCGVLVGVEVKVRTTGRSGSGAESITLRRIHRLRCALAEYLLGRRPSRSGSRLDLIELSRTAAGGWRLRHVRGIDRW
jgi:putative endonuclease